MNDELLANIERLHTTDMGITRIKTNLGLDCDDVVAYCRNLALSPEATIERRGKNWYVMAAGAIITINAHSYTIITAHREK